MQDPQYEWEAEFWYRTKKEKRIIDAVIKKLKFRNNAMAFGANNPVLNNPNIVAFNVKDKIFILANLKNLCESLLNWKTDHISSPNNQREVVVELVRIALTWRKK